jgi:hypothetical protein
VRESPLFLGVIYPALPLHEAGAVKNDLWFCSVSSVL